jgi:hypothetical protein
MTAVAIAEPLTLFGLEPDGSDDVQRAALAARRAARGLAGSAPAARAAEHRDAAAPALERPQPEVRELVREAPTGRVAERPEPTARALERQAPAARALERPAPTPLAAASPAAPPEERPAGPAGRPEAAEPTLAQLVAGTWTTLRGHHAIACLVCGSSMEPIYGAHALPVAGRCRDCGTELT